MKSEYYQVKFIIIGDSFVGKTNIYYRFVKGDFKNDYEPTVVLNFLYQKIKIKDKNFTLQLWDTAGSEQYKSVTRGYYSNSACCIFVYDITNEASFNSINDWVEEVKNNVDEKTNLILVGNKYDLSNERKITEDQGSALALQYNMKFIETSAKTGYNIDEIFKIACQQIYENIEKKVYDFENNEEIYGIKICHSNNDFVYNKTFALKTEKDDVHNQSNKGSRKSVKNKKKKC